MIERRRHILARKVELDRFESRSMITESLGIAMLGIGIPGAAAIVQKHQASGAHTGAEQALRAHLNGHVLPISATPVRHAPQPEAGGGKAPVAVVVSSPVPAGDWLTLKTPQVTDELPVGAGASRMLDEIKKSAARTGGGAASQPRGSAGGTPAARGAITPLQLSAPGQNSSSANLNALGASVGASSGSFSHASRSAAVATASGLPANQTSGFQTNASTQSVAITQNDMIQQMRLGGGLAPLAQSMGNSSGAAKGQFTVFSAIRPRFQPGPDHLSGGPQAGHARRQR